MNSTFFSKIFRLCATFIFVCSASGESLAASWNLADDFSLYANPNGTWSYGYNSTAGGSVTTSTAQLASNYLGKNGTLVYWMGPYLQGGNYFPNIAKFYGEAGADSMLIGTAQSTTCVVQQRAGGIVLHPAPSYQAVVVWTAPVAGQYFINTTFYNADCSLGATTNVRVYVKGVAQLNAALSGFTSLQNWNSGNSGVALLANEKIQIEVGNGGNGSSSDSTGVDVFIRNLNIKAYRSK